MALPTGDLRISLLVDAAQWEGTFNSLEVWRSTTGEAGPYEILTGDSWLPARLPKGAADAPDPPITGPSALLNGTSLKLLVNEETHVEVAFTGATPMTFAAAAAQVNAQGLQLVRAYVVGTTFVVETTETGTNALLRVEGGEAAPFLGLSYMEPDSVAYGKDVRLPLITGKSVYEFVDHNGDASYFYKIRFFNSANSTASEFSEPISGQTAASSLSANSLVKAYVELVDDLGVALADRVVLLSTKGSPAIVENKVVIGKPRQVLTDERGYAEFMVVRGQSFTVAIAGTDIVRDFVAPEDSSIASFNMLDPAYSSDDVFNVQRPDLRYAVRRSM